MAPSHHPRHSATIPPEALSHHPRLQPAAAGVDRMGSKGEALTVCHDMDDMLLAAGCDSQHTEKDCCDMHG